MGFYSDKVRKYWFPFIILMIIVLAVGWVVAGVIYPSNVQGNDQVVPTTIPPTSTEIPTSTPTASPTLQATSTAPTLAATATPTYNCTYSAYYWTTNADAWVIENLLLGNLSYTKIEALEIMALEEPTPTERLMGQFFAALLNTLKGADSFEIDAVIVKARDWLILRPHGVDLSQAEIQEIEILHGTAGGIQLRLDWTRRLQRRTRDTYPGCHGYANSHRHLYTWTRPAFLHRHCHQEQRRR